MNEAKPNEYGFARTRKDQDHITFTNATTRALLHREMVVVKDANNLAHIGFVVQPEGIAAAASGEIDLMTGDVIATGQREDAGTFVAGNANVFVSEQTNSVPAEIKQATAAGLFPLPAFIVSTVNGASGRLEVRMPAQNGTIAAAV